MTQPSVLAILGPTASGKTQLALDLAQALPIEIISLDSALIYRDMNIGTAKPTAAEMALVPHHLIDIISPLDSYSAADFCRDALALIQEITDRGKLPVPDLQSLLRVVVRPPRRRHRLQQSVALLENPVIVGAYARHPRPAIHHQRVEERAPRGRIPFHH